VILVNFNLFPNADLKCTYVFFYYIMIIQTEQAESYINSLITQNR